MSTSQLSITRLYLIRHGESYPNVEPIIGGMIGDAGLTDLGIAQARALRDRLAATNEIQADILIASTLPRARQTAAIIAPALGREILLDDEVQELRPGEADGMHVADAKAKYGIPDFRRNPYASLSPGGESWPEFTIRVGRALNRIWRTHEGKNIVVVCHGGVIDSSFQIFMNLYSHQPPIIEFRTQNTSITQWERHEHPERTTRWRLTRYNDDHHLMGLERREGIDWSTIPARSASTEHPAIPIPTEIDAG